MNDTHKPIASDDPIAPEEILKTVKCSCKSGCTSKRCSCVKGRLSCSQFCSCSDICKNKDMVDFIDVKKTRMKLMRCNICRRSLDGDNITP